MTLLLVTWTRGGVWKTR